MTETARRAVPHINQTAALVAAAAAVSRALGVPPIADNLRGLNGWDVQQVRAAIGQVSIWRDDPSFYLEGETEGTEIGAVEFLILLATLLREHLKAGNT